MHCIYANHLHLRIDGIRVAASASKETVAVIASRILLSAALVLTAFAPAVEAAEPLDAQLEAYVADARSVVAAIHVGKADAQGPALQRLAERADAMIAPFVARFPVCADYLHATQALKTTWRNLSLERIEADFHKDGALPKIEGAQDRALCYQMKDLLVHPLTGLRLLEEPALDTASLRREVDEVVAHGGALKALVATRATR